MLNSARPTTLTAAFCGNTAVNTDGNIPQGDVVIVNGAMTGIAQRQTIRWIKAQFRMLGKRFDVVSMQLYAGALTVPTPTLPAGVIIADEYGIAPIDVCHRSPDAFVNRLNARAITPSRGGRSLEHFGRVTVYTELARLRAERTEPCLCRVLSHRLIALWTGNIHREAFKTGTTRGFTNRVVLAAHTAHGGAISLGMNSRVTQARSACYAQ